MDNIRHTCEIYERETRKYVNTSLIYQKKKISEI